MNVCGLPCPKRSLQGQINNIYEVKENLNNQANEDFRMDLAERLGVSAKIISDDEYLEALADREDPIGKARYAGDLGANICKSFIFISTSFCDD